MKLALFFISVLMLSTSVMAYVTECNQTEKLQCKVQYTIRSQQKLIEQSAEDVGSYELINWDEPSLAYCEASTGFNQNGIYVIGSMGADHTISVSIRHRNGDYPTTTIDGSTGIAATSTVSFVPEIDLSKSGVAGTLVSATATCKMAR